MTPTGPEVQEVVVTAQYERAAAQFARYRWVRALISFLITGLVALILVRILLKFLAANPDNAIVRLVYDITAPFVEPFLTILPAPSVAVGSVLELSAFVAIGAYLLLGWALVRLARLIIVRPSTGATVTRVEHRR